MYKKNKKIIFEIHISKLSSTNWAVFSYFTPSFNTQLMKNMLWRAFQNNDFLFLNKVLKAYRTLILALSDRIQSGLLGWREFNFYFFNKKTGVNAKTKAT